MEDTTVDKSGIKAIFYTSNTGFTKKYAEMLSKKLDIPAYSMDTSADAEADGTEIIYLGWICAGGIKGYEQAAKRYQVKALCGVGLSVDSGRQVDELALHHKVSESTEVFYLQGGFDMHKLGFVHKLMMKAMRDVVGRSLKKKDDPSQDEIAAYTLMCKGGECVDEKALDQIVEWYHAQ